MAATGHHLTFKNAVLGIFILKPKCQNAQIAEGGEIICIKEYFWKGTIESVMDQD